MNNYDNRHDKVNNNYDQSYKQEGAGQHSYSYTPKDTQKSKTRKMIVRFIFLGAASVLLSVMVILPGIVFGAFAIKNFLKGSDNNTSAAAVSGDSTAADHGISTIDVTSKNLYYYSRYGISSVGVIVTDSEYTDELEFGDKIISVNGVDISVSDDIARAVSDCVAGDKISFTVERGNEIITVEIILRERAADYVEFE